jgi:hypothetical protein
MSLRSSRNPKDFNLKFDFNVNTKHTPGEIGNTP